MSTAKFDAFYSELYCLHFFNLKDGANVACIVLDTDKNINLPVQTVFPLGHVPISTAPVKNAKQFIEKDNYLVQRNISKRRSHSDGTSTSETSETSRFLLSMSMFLTSMFKDSMLRLHLHRNFLFSMFRKSMFSGFYRHYVLRSRTVAHRRRRPTAATVANNKKDLL